MSRSPTFEWTQRTMVVAFVATTMFPPDATYTSLTRNLQSCADCEIASKKCTHRESHWGSMGAVGNMWSDTEMMRSLTKTNDMCSTNIQPLTAVGWQWVCWLAAHKTPILHAVEFRGILPTSAQRSLSPPAWHLNHILVHQWNGCGNFQKVQIA